MADNQTISQDDLQSLATKLAQFSKTLNPGEQVALEDQLKHTPATDEDVQGYEYSSLYHRFADERRADLQREAEQARLMASSQPTHRPGMVRVAIGRMGTLLIGLGTRMKQVEIPKGTATRPA
jgi:hypothetical protein